MKQIVIKKMEITNFKGINHLVFDFYGKNIKLVGANGTGKTSVFDAFTWCLFGKDSKDRSDSNKDFEIKPKDPITGDQIHNLEVTVELTLSVNGNLAVLKRVYSEVWTKKRGETESEFSGHTTKYYVNGVEKLQKDYLKFISEEIVTEDLFKMLTNVNYFPTLKWEEQRKVLEELVNVTDEGIIKKHNELKELANHMILGNDVEDIIAIQNQDKKKINNQLEIGIPSQLKALHEIEYKSLGVDYNDDANSKKLEESYSKLSNIESQLVSGSNQAKLLELESAKFSLENDIRKIEREIEELRFKDRQASSSRFQTEKDKLASLERELKTLQDDAYSISERIEKGKKLIEEGKSDKEILYQEYDAVEAEVFQDSNCSYCGQVLPMDKLEEAKEHFNKHKSERLEAIKEKGITYNSMIDKYQSGVDSLEKQSISLHKQQELKGFEISNQKKVIHELENKPIITEENPQIAILEKKITEIRPQIKVVDNQILRVKEGGSNSLLEGAKKEIKNEIEYLNTCKAEYALKLQNQEKINRLELEQKELLKKQEDIFRIISTGERFRDIKANFISNEVNKHFKLVEFKLFEILVNGGIKPTCVSTYKGVLYPSCSNGQKINIGLDIINGLQNIFGVSAPIFVDNAEAVSNWLVESNSQLIKMYVDPNVKSLEIVEIVEEV